MPGEADTEADAGRSGHRGGCRAAPSERHGHRAGRERAGGGAHDELGHARVLLRRLAVAEHGQYRGERVPPEPVEVLAHGRERRGEVLGLGDVVEADDAHLLGHAAARAVPLYLDVARASSARPELEPGTSGAVALYLATSAPTEIRAVTRGHALRATDAGWEFGRGPVLEATAIELVEFLGGRSLLAPRPAPRAEAEPPERG